MLRFSPRFAAFGFALAVLAGCAQEAPPPPPPPPPPPLPTVTLAPSVIEEAGAYRSYMAKATAISPVF
ncbi:MAG TPA: hypothetical protein VF138_00465, partial [Caulobacteraceae bacterium]